MEASPHIFVLTRIPPLPAAVVPRRTEPSTDYDMAAVIYTRLGIIKRITGFSQMTDQNLQIARKKEYDRRDCFAPLLYCWQLHLSGQASRLQLSC